MKPAVAVFCLLSLLVLTVYGKPNTVTDTLGLYETIIEGAKTWIASGPTTRGTAFIPLSNGGGLQFPIVDQTVWFIEKSKFASAKTDGYFQANVVGMFEFPVTAYDSLLENAAANGQTAITISLPTGNFLSVSCMRSMFSITPEGSVYGSFIGVGGSTSPITTGLGKFYKVNGPIKDRWQFLMQMGSGSPGSLTLQHWSYMVACLENEPCYNNLPGSNLTVTESYNYCAEAFGTVIDPADL